MGYDLLAGLLFAALAPLVALGFVAYWVVTARDREDHASVLARWASSRGLDYVAPEGEWPNRTSAAVVWSHKGTEMRVSILGRESKAKTRLTVRPRSALLGELVAAPDRDTGATLRSRSRPAAFAARVLDPQVTRAVLGFCQRDRVVLTYRRGRFQLEWPGREANDARLDAARRVGELLAATVEDRFRAPASSRAA